MAQTAVAAAESTAPSFVRSHQLGARIGGWANQGILPPARQDISDGSYYLTHVSNGSFYFEGFFGYRMNRSLMFELSLGLVSRGDVTLVEPDSGGANIGTLQLYPVNAKLKFYPFTRANGTIFPYVFAGGGFTYGRHDIQFSRGYNAYLRAEFGQNSETDFTYVVGGGVDWPVASMIGLELSGQYMPVNFSGRLIGVRDYSAITITVGIKYLMTSLDSKKPSYR